ncbi:hypothetical protein QRO08_10020 [Paracidovorax citrulli]|uniref:Uncharacterized protein n=1 Tax=Paracidovorax citrulli TaxID=80869 RepID=A0ABY9AVR1_PARCI|nr:hypothetical protein [Paracidovorax citrulli]MVT29071.1 hypothetical protein [Paracidovorax citrulli]WIY31250.1 hypothetical protein QRO09_05895 [Paracidovorax citrulli]WIY40529.1 hypothetical protein QRO10_06175 [Paracidovorax citrulli]WIY42238.1 hypothetical protein QRO12_14855 [Paracidovorax citrulli]WIY50874.1 hypothetical protein QRO08_10020 [Paracidovorax citrulli]
MISFTSVCIGAVFMSSALVGRMFADHGLAPQGPWGLLYAIGFMVLLLALIGRSL